MSTIQQSLSAAFEDVASGRKALNELIKEPGFHSSLWQQAFVQMFDHLEALKFVSSRDAAALGKVYCAIIDSLCDQILEEPENRFSVANLCTIAQYGGGGIGYAKRHFESVLLDLEESRYTHELRFTMQSDVKSAISTLRQKQNLPAWVSQENNLSVQFQTTQELKKEEQGSLLALVPAIASHFNQQDNELFYEDSSPVKQSIIYRHQLRFLHVAESMAAIRTLDRLDFMAKLEPNDYLIIEFETTEKLGTPTQAHILQAIRPDGQSFNVPINRSDAEEKPDHAEYPPHLGDILYN